MPRTNIVVLAALLVLTSCLERKTVNQTDGAVAGVFDGALIRPGTGGVSGVDSDRSPDPWRPDGPAYPDAPSGHDSGDSSSGTGEAAGGGGNAGLGGSGVMASGGMTGTGGVQVDAGSGPVATGGGPVATGGSPGTGGVVGAGGGPVATGGGPVATGGSAGTGGVVGAGGGSAQVGGSAGNGTGGRMGTGGTTGLSNGAPCTAASVCASNACADGVCCDVPCEGQCEACNTTANRGICSPTTVARTPCATDGSVCGGVCDGTAVHRKACVYPSSSSPCGRPAECNAATNQASTAQYCSTSSPGACSPPIVTSCAPYPCNGTVCATSCPAGQGVCGGTCVNVLSDPTHCGTACAACPASSAPKCYNGNCVACTTASDCVVLGYGPGSACDTNSCLCRPKSASNILQNPGLDGSLSGWTIAFPALATYDGAKDADTCSASGSVRVTYAGADAGMISQCVAAKPSTRYYFGYKYEQDEPDAVVCFVWFYPGGTCSGDVLDGYTYQGRSTPVESWAISSNTFNTPPGTGSIRVFCQINAAAVGWFDQFYLNESVAGY
jgi:hypothetical protein